MFTVVSGSVALGHRSRIGLPTPSAHHRHPLTVPALHCPSVCAQRRIAAACASRYGERLVRRIRIIVPCGDRHRRSVLDVSPADNRQRLVGLAQRECRPRPPEIPLRSPCRPSAVHSGGVGVGAAQSLAAHRRQRDLAILRDGSAGVSPQSDARRRRMLCIGSSSSPVIVQVSRRMPPTTPPHWSAEDRRTTTVSFGRVYIVVHRGDCHRYRCFSVSPAAKLRVVPLKVKSPA